MQPFPTAFMLAHAFHQQHQEETIGDGVKAIVRGYYDNYTDAEALEPDAYRLLEQVLALVDIDLDLEELIREAETEINESGGIVGSEGNRHKVHTPMAWADEEGDD